MFEKDKQRTPTVAREKRGVDGTRSWTALDVGGDDDGGDKAVSSSGGTDTISHAPKLVTIHNRPNRAVEVEVEEEDVLLFSVGTQCIRRTCPFDGNPSIPR